MIEIERLIYRWPGARQATLDIEHLAVAAGESVFLHGPSGCGKSTLLGLLAGVLLPRQGQVKLMGRDWGSLSGPARDAARARHVGYVFQQFNLLPFLSVQDNVLLACRFSQERRRRAQALHAGGATAAAQSLLARMGLARPLWSQPAGRLSVGQQQRVAAARALIGQPELVIADEPTSALDAQRRDDFMALLMGECRAHGSTLVFVSHDERLAEGFDTRLSLPRLNRAAPVAGSGGAAD